MKKVAFSAERLETHLFNFTAIEHLHRYAIAKEFCNGKNVLDIASGEGYGSNLLAQVATQVTGVDIDNITIENAKKTYKRSNLNFKVGTCSAIPIDDHNIDVVVSFETIEHHNQHDKMLREIKRVLKNDGILIISTPDKKYYSDKLNYKNPFHVKEIYLQEFQTLISNYFQFQKIYFQRYVSGSLIYNQEEHGKFDEFSGDYSAVEKNINPHGLYNICIAGNQEIGCLNTSIFTSEAAAEHDKQQLIERIQQSNSYRLGHFLLSPMRAFTRWFR